MYKNPKQKYSYMFTKEETEALGIKSRVKRIKSILRSEYLSLDDVTRIKDFYSRFYY